MSNHNSLPGFDAWLTRQPTEEDIEPSDQDLIDARERLREEEGIVSDEGVYNLACMLASARQDRYDAEAEEHAAESSREDSEDRFGDGP